MKTLRAIHDNDKNIMAYDDKTYTLTYEQLRDMLDSAYAGIDKSPVIN